MVMLADLGGWPGVLGPLSAGKPLDRAHAHAAMREILAGNATPAQLAGFVVALRMKGETIDELSGLLDGLLDAAELVDLDDALRDRVVDIVGTGGDRSHTVNVSTLAALVVAGAGAPVCKHGNRAASSSCGSADVLEALGVALELSPAGIGRCLREAGMAFCFAPRFHPALRHAGPTRRELGIPTAFNMLGPLANPARARRYLLGVADPKMAPKMAGVLAAHGAIHAMIVHGDDGLDELTTTTTSTVVELRDGEVRTWTLDPRHHGIAAPPADALRGGEPALNASIAKAVLDGGHGPVRDVVVLNAAAGLVVADLATSFDGALALAAQVIDDGRARAALDRLITVSQSAADPGAGAP